MKISRLLRALRPGCRQGNEGIYLASILYRISVSKLINSTQYIFFLLWLNWQQFSHAEETAKGRYRSTKNG